MKLNQKEKKGLAERLETAYRRNGKCEEFKAVSAEIVSNGYHWSGVYSVCSVSGGDVYEVCKVDDIDNFALPNSLSDGKKINYLSDVAIREKPFRS